MEEKPLCHECRSDDVHVLYATPAEGERGAFTIICNNEGCLAEFHVPAEAKSRVRIHALRAIVRDHEAARIDGFIVDAFTAQMLVAVYEALSPENRERFGKPRLERLVELGWKHATPGGA